MPEPITVYAVSRGEYSDYNVIAIFATEPQADAFVEQQQSERWDPYVEEMTFYPEGVEARERRYYVVTLKDGEVHSRGQQKFTIPPRSNAFTYNLGTGGTWAHGYSTRSYAAAEHAGRDKLTALELQRAGL